MLDFQPNESESQLELSNTSLDNMFDIYGEATEDIVLSPIEVDIWEESIREVGKPEELADYWHYQESSNDCALYAQGGLLEADGKPFDIDRYQQQGIDGGWYSSEEGVYIDHFGDLLEENGMTVGRYDGATIQDLVEELDQDHGVVVAVDCLQIWGEPGGHALWVTGIEVDEEGVPLSVVCNDSGREDGKKISYPYEDFKLAWGLYNNTMVATKDRLSNL